MKKLILALALMAVGFQTAYAYDVTDRYKLLEDRFKTQDMMNEVAHDFFFDIRVGANKNVIDFTDDVSEAADNTDFGSDDLQALNDFLNDYEKTEQTVNAHVALGFPLPSFSAFNVNFKPNFRASWNLGLNMGVFKEPLNASNVLDLVDVQLPAEIETKIRNRIRSQPYGNLAGKDIVQDVCSNAGVPQSKCDPYVDKYFYPSDTDVPNVFMLAKQDVKAGFFTSYTYGEDFFGHFNIYGMHRTDLFARLSQDDLARDDDVVDLGDELNSEVYLTADWHLGWKKDRYSITGGIEEIKIATLQEREENSKQHTYGNDPLLRLHGQAEYNISNLKLTPFAGIHKRSGYSVGEGVYAGADVMAHLWAERLALRLRGQIDKEHLTISPMAKLWFMHLDYTLKQPLSSEVDGIKVSALHSVNFRMFF